MSTTVGEPGQAGPFAGTTSFRRTGTYSIPASGTLKRGQPLCRDITQLSGFFSTRGGGAPAANVPTSGGQSDILVLPTSANAGACFGVYQGPDIVNPSSTTALVVPVQCMKMGYGVVLAGALAAGTAITVGLIIAEVPTQTFAVADPGTGTRTQLGIVLATVLANGTLVSAPAGSIIAVPGSGNAQLLVMCDIDIGDTHGGIA
jgi:hypothetical protein